MRLAGGEEPQHGVSTITAGAPGSVAGCTTASGTSSQLGRPRSVPNSTIATQPAASAGPNGNGRFRRGADDGDDAGDGAEERTDQRGPDHPDQRRRDPEVGPPAHPAEHEAHDPGQPDVAEPHAPRAHQMEEHQEREVGDPTHRSTSERARDVLGEGDDHQGRDQHGVGPVDEAVRDPHHPEIDGRHGDEGREQDEHRHHSEVVAVRGGGGRPECTHRQFDDEVPGREAMARVAPGSVRDRRRTPPRAVRRAPGAPRMWSSGAGILGGQTGPRRCRSAAEARPASPTIAARPHSRTTRRGCRRSRRSRRRRRPPPEPYEHSGGREATLRERGAQRIVRTHGVGNDDPPTVRLGRRPLNHGADQRARELEQQAALARDGSTAATRRWRATTKSFPVTSARTNRPPPAASTATSIASPSARGAATSTSTSWRTASRSPAAMDGVSPPTSR